MTELHKEIYYSTQGSLRFTLHICLGGCGNETAQRTYQLQVDLRTHTYISEILVLCIGSGEHMHVIFTLCMVM